MYTSIEKTNLTKGSKKQITKEMGFCYMSLFSNQIPLACSSLWSKNSALIQTRDKVRNKKRLYDFLSSITVQPIWITIEV